MSTARLTQAIDRLVSTIRALVPPDADPLSVVAFEMALGDLLAEVLSAASAQSAGATLQLLSDVHARMAALEAERAP